MRNTEVFCGPVEGVLKTYPNSSVASKKVLTREDATEIGDKGKSLLYSRYPRTFHGFLSVIVHYSY